MIRTIIITFILSLAFNAKADAIDSVLRVLDHEIEVAPTTYLPEKESTINKLRKTLAETENEHARFKTYKSLYSEYLYYQYDSAYVYARRMEKLADRFDEQGMKMQARAALLNCFSSVGFFNEGMDVLADMQPHYLPRQEQIDYYLSAAKLLQNMESYVDGSSDLIDKYKSMRTSCYDSVLSLADKDSYDYAIAVLERDRIPAYAGLKGISACKQIMDRFNLDLHQKAINCSTIGRSYAWHEKNDSAIYFLALSAIYDLRSNTKETTAAKDLATLMLKKGDLERASRYINIASDDAQAYNSRLRKVEINSVMPIIESARHNKLSSQRLLLIISLSVFAIMLTIVLYLFFKLRTRNKSLTESHEEINKKNSELKDANEALEEVNTKLKEADEIKDQYIIESLYSKNDFVSEVEEKSKKALMKLKGKKYAEVENLLSDMGVRREQARMYASFDSVFMKLFPNFIDELNNLLNPDERITLDGDKLPTEIRIFALIRLGIDSPADIAQYLGLSVNTVYVYKAKLKARSNVGKLDFEKLVKAIPKP
jgi:hypothetical protein